MDTYHIIVIKDSKGCRSQVYQPQTDKCSSMTMMSFFLDDTQMINEVGYDSSSI